jgi:hypothetical protein
VVRQEPRINPRSYPGHGPKRNRSHSYGFTIMVCCELSNPL